MEDTRVGQSVRRKEDIDLVKGKSPYTDDLNLAGQYYAYFVRSPYAHAEIRSIDTREAATAPGVRAVYTSEQILADDLGTMPCLVPIPNANGEPMFAPPRHLLAVDRIRYVGDPIAMVVAESQSQAIEAADLIDIEFNELPFNVETAKAIDPDTPRLWPDCKNNISLNFQAGDAEATDAAIKNADIVVELDLVNNRLIPNPMELRCCLADYDSEKDLHTLYAPSQGPMVLKTGLSKFIFKKPWNRFHVISKTTGGSFGARAELSPELCLCVWAAMKLNNPVKWTSSRAECFLTDLHGRDNVSHGTLALNNEGKILGLKVNTSANMGAYLAGLGVFIPTLGGGKVTGTIYNVPAVHLTVNCVFTNTAPTGAYRGAGRPEASYVIERLLEAAALKMGIGSDEIRYRNFIKPEDLPYTNFHAIEIKSGDFAMTQRMALEQADWGHFEERQKISADQGKLRGIGIGYFVETSGGGPIEPARVRFESDGSVSVLMETYSYGQGHETVFSQIVAEQLGVPFERVNLIQGDSGIEREAGEGPLAGITGGSRTSQMGGVAVLRACQSIVEKGKPIAAHLLQATSETLLFESGNYKDQHTGSSMHIVDVAKAALDAKNLPEGVDTGLDETYLYNRGGGFTFPNGCHVCEVEVDPETGIVEVVRYTAVDDCGNIINPMLVHGQSHGAITQGFGQAMLEQGFYDPQSGQLLTGSFMDYTMPRAHHLPGYDLEFNIVPDPGNDLGVKGAGEGGSCGAPPAIVHAVLNALKGYGITHLDMPLTAEQIWQAIQNSK